MIEIFQIYYQDSQQQNLVDGFIPYFNKKKSIFVENQCMYDIRHNNLSENASHVGVFSYKFHDKILSRPTFESISTCISSNSDVDIFSPKIKTLWWKPIRTPKPLYFPNQANMKKIIIPFLSDLADLNIIKRSSIDLWTEVCENPIYCNIWVAKKSIFIDYVDNFLDEVFKLIEKYDQLNPIFNMDTTYPCEPPLEWQDQTGFKSYPIITFTLERLINIYVGDRGLNHQAIL